MQKIITEILPASSGLTFAKDARDLLIECCVEFITLISSEANDIAEKEAKKTIACDHVEKALRDLGFEDYVQEVLDVANEHKEQLKVHYPHRKANCIADEHRGRQERRSKARWSRVACRRRSCSNSSRSCSVRQRINIIRRHRRHEEGILRIDGGRCYAAKSWRCRFG